ncbi:phage tail protein I [Pseudomonas fluorescens]|uniref:phage tail protein I n=1 Tax=Pseudomonas fluorescens TaxID=294 RepID=UPI00259B8329|nr:phage tail protein I [Pseudomonas fluorescens]WJK10268.1 phage tail protein I [Pseudomonas fluorescens]
MSKSLLPSGSTPLERAATEAMAEAVALKVPLRDLWSPDRCPLSLLPYLAWALSVDRWDQNWSEKTKRAVIKASFFVHKRKGTINAIRRAVEPLGYLIELIEWWQTAPMGTPGTFALKLGVLETGITEEMYLEVERLIDDAKPVSRHLTGLAISLETQGNLNVGVSLYDGDVIDIYPPEMRDIDVTGTFGVVGREHSIDTLDIYS